MENLDLTKILKVGDKVYSPTFGYGIVQTVDSIGTYAIHINFKTIDMQKFSKYGKYYANDTDTECSIFPSKENRDWSSVIPINEKANYFVSLSGDVWSLYKYTDLEIENIKCNKCTSTFRYIVPVVSFNVLVKNFSDNIINSIINANDVVTPISGININTCNMLASNESPISDASKIFHEDIKKIDSQYIDGFYPIGKELKLSDGRLIRVEESDICIGCIYKEQMSCKHFGKDKCCGESNRSDGNSVIFKKIN